MKLTFLSNFNTGVKLAEDFHVFGSEWDPEYLVFYFDENEVVKEIYAQYLSFLSGLSTPEI